MRRREPGAAARASLLRYRVMAYLVGIGLIVLVLVGVPLKYAAGDPTVVAIVGPVHGALYILYLISAADMLRHIRWPVTELVPVILAGLLPFLAFVVERRTTRRVRAYLETLSGAPPSGP